MGTRSSARAGRAETGRWFLAPPTDWARDEIVLPEDESHHALRVLRLAVGDVVSITDGRGGVARARVARVEAGRVVATVQERRSHARPRPEIAVYQGAAKGRKVDGVVERLAELGVAELSVYTSRRAVVTWTEAKRAKLRDRWRAIARAAAKQSRNPFVLEVDDGLEWPALLDKVARESLALALWEEAATPLRAALPDPAGRVALLVGPEGGLAPDEAGSLRDAGAELVSLGDRILRTENAPVVAVAALLFRYGAIG